MSSLESVHKSNSADDTNSVELELPGIIQKASTSIHSLTQEERRAVMQLWSHEIHDQAMDDLLESVKETDSSIQQISKIHDEVDRRVLQCADVIGVTTTGLAKRISVLRRVNCRIVICEEAGEVMEAHMISALLPTVQHFIQIGDHEQLRPQINDFIRLSLESKQGGRYQLDRSQFERLSVGQPGRLKMPVAQLNVQRRMRPEISTLIRETIYPRLEDHSSVVNLPDTVGMRKNVFWLDHDHCEDREESQRSEAHHKSHSNAWEVEMVQGLVRHIVRQGTYSSNDIAVLTPYTGQLQKLRSAMRKDFEIVLSDRDQEALDKDGFNLNVGDLVDEQPNTINQAIQGALQKKTLSELLRIATVDNFQGEEAKVIIVSLVRSNGQKKVGFLKTTNRINVLLSRARHGMYLIGSAETYSNVAMWQKVIAMLKASDSLGSALGLCCPRHQDSPIQVSEPEDFPRLSPEGGCRLACPWRLPDCGHMCQARCHSEAMHRVFACPQPCQRLHKPCEHACRRTCGEDCGKCLIKLQHVRLPCGHFKDDVLCHRAQNPGIIYCHTLVSKTVSACGHSIEAACSHDVTSPGFRCPHPCTTILSCGHPCPGTCGKCSTSGSTEESSVTHQKCTKICGRPFGACNHTCLKQCHEANDCGLCLSPCEVRCQHSKCALRCHEACAPCIEPCTWACNHQGSCSMPCSVPCNRLPCDQRCSKELPCGHQCPGICGELCPAASCHQCGMKQDVRVDLLEMKTYAEVNVDQTPVIALQCGHIFTAETLDGHVGMTEVYATDRCGRFVALADISSALATKIPKCPDCQRVIRQYTTQRYNRVINRAVIDEMTRRFILTGKAELIMLELRLAGLTKEMEQSRSKFISSLKNGKVANDVHRRYEPYHILCKAIGKFLRRAADDYQPARKLYEAQIHATRATDSEFLTGALASLSLRDSIAPEQRDRRIILGGRMIEIRAESIVLEDKFSVLKASRSSAAQPYLQDGSLHSSTRRYLQTCATFIRDCNTDALPKLAVEASLYFAHVVRLHRSAGLSTDTDQGKTEHTLDARELLEKAIDLCKQPFQNADQLRSAAEESIRLLRKEWYEELSPDELTSIKHAMVTGPGGIATHSGHWYKCAKGHPVSVFPFVVLATFVHFVLVSATPCQHTHRP